jgi:hypothetical protein
LTPTKQSIRLNQVTGVHNTPMLAARDTPGDRISNHAMQSLGADDILFADFDDFA